MNFKDLNIVNPLLKALDKKGFQKATEIQEEVIPLAIKGKDILAIAQTGSGKTLGFGLPVLNNLYNLNLEKESKEGKVKRKIESLIVAPTRELAMQIGEDLKPFSTNTNLKITTIFGGVNDFHQKKAIEKGIDILIATPGRLEDLISQGVVKLSYVKILVLDEADRMLNMGFLPDIKKIIKRIPKDRQTLFFSATMPKEIKELAGKLLNNNEEIFINKPAFTSENIKQEVFHIKSSNKRKLLQFLVKKKEYKNIIVFVRTKDDTEYVLEYIKSIGISSDNIHRNRSQNARQRALKALKDGSIKVLVATDIASRGLDVDNLSCVINYNIPSEPDDYVHRIGRTARAGKTGIAISFCTEKDKENLEKIEKLIGKKIEINNDEKYKEEIIPKGKILGYVNFEEGFKKEKKTRKSIGKKRYYQNKKKK